VPSGVTRVGVTRVSNWRCHTYFCPKNLETFFVITCQFYSVTPICFLVKNWRPFSSSLSLLLISVGCHPATVLPVRPCSSTILCKFSHNFFSIQVSPPWGVSPGVVCPSPQWCHCLCLLCTVCRWKCVLVMNLWPACVQHRNLLMSLWSPSFLSSWLHFPENFILLCIFSDSCIQITCNQSASGAVQVLDPLLYRLCTFISTAGASLHETVLDLSMQLAAFFCRRVYFKACVISMIVHFTVAIVSVKLFHCPFHSHFLTRLFLVPWSGKRSPRQRRHRQHHGGRLQSWGWVGQYYCAIYTVELHDSCRCRKCLQSANVI